MEDDTKPEIRMVPVIEFNERVIQKILDEKGNWIGIIEKRWMTREEIEKMYPTSPPNP